MTTASGMFKTVAYKVESTFGTIPSASSAQLLRRVTSSLELSKDTYQSNEIRPDFQVADFRHGVRKVGGTISGELSPKTYADFFAAALKKDFAAGVSVTGASITVGGTLGAYTITRAAGSWVTDGVKLGDIGRLTAGAFNANNLNKNVQVYAITATVLTVLTLNGSTMTTEGPIATATFAVTGKKTIVPSTGQTDKSFSVEHFFADVPSSEVFSGCKVSKLSVGLPPTGIATLGVDFMGKDMLPAGTQYFTSPTAITTTGALAAVNGVVIVNAAPIANLTGLSFDVSCDQDGQPVVGANTVPFLAAKRVIVTGQATMTFASTTFRDAFVNETECAIAGAFTTDNTAGADFVSFVLPRLKFSGATKDDGEKTLTLTLPFQALLNAGAGNGAGYDLTTLGVQDSQA